MNEWLRFKDAGQRAIDAGIAWELKASSDEETMRLSYSVCGKGEYERSRWLSLRTGQ